MLGSIELQFSKRLLRIRLIETVGEKRTRDQIFTVNFPFQFNPDARCVISNIKIASEQKQRKKKKQIISTSKEFSIFPCKRLQVEKNENAGRQKFFA